MSFAVWASISNATGYEVSSDGRVRSIDRIKTLSDGRKRLFPGIGLTPTLRNGYLSVKLTLNDGRRRTFPVHRLVCRTFHGTPPTPTHEVRHLNGVKTDNHSENLRWGTRAENVQDQIRHGVHPMASKTHCPNGHPYDRFYGPARNRSCSICTTVLSRRSVAGRRESILEQRQRYKANNREKIAANAQRYRAENAEAIREKRRQWYAKNREAIQERRRISAQQRRKVS